MNTSDNMIMGKRHKIAQYELEVCLQKPGKKSFNNLDLSGLDFGYYDISGKDFISCDLTNANFITAKPVRDCNFKDCDISHTKFGNIMRCDFDNCHGFQTDFQKSEITETNFLLCDLEKVDFRESNIFESAFNHCVIKEANFSDGELFSVNFLNNNLLKGVNFDNSKMKNVEVTDAMLYECSIQKADIKGVGFYNSNFIRSNLSESNFQNTSIWHSDVVSTDLSNAKFKETDLGSAYFTQPVKGLETCIFDQCGLPYNYEDMILSPKDKIENLRQELIKDQSFYNAYALTELNNDILVSELPIRFMQDVVETHGTDTQKIQKAIESVAIRDSMHPEDMVKLLQDTRNTEEYRAALEKEQGKTEEKSVSRS
ncbi:MAG: pentapeptide repeat-containing protein [Selenomonadaceae bacterium]|nr:pentapeptide repeat-containing protein [Selenomonadaceae bacterium]